jgi:hypothetical protein
VKKLFLTLKQAEQLGRDLIEYSKMTDSSDRYLFKGFELSFGDLAAEKPQGGESFEVTPLPEFLEINEN